MGTKSTATEAVREALDELERLNEQIQLKLHLAGMDAKKAYDEKLEPRLREARAHAAEAKEHSKEKVEDAVKALREFVARLASHAP
ncbi:MAG: hypothetical protein KF819_29985 [Labilithrix sp.]|nr:hypothetical protein [Labilithrix sp.]